MLKATSTEQVRTHLEKAIKREQPVTLTYFEEEKDQETGKRTGRKNADGSKALVETVRTIEPTEIRETKDGNLIVRATDRKDGKTKSWRLDRIKTYTIHRTTFTAEQKAIITQSVVQASAPAPEFIEAALSVYSQVPEQMRRVMLARTWNSWTPEQRADWRTTYFGSVPVHA